MSDQNSGNNPSAAFIVEVVIAGLCVFAVAITVALLTDASPGSAPDWIAAISTFAAFVAAVFAGWYAHHALRVEQQRDAHRDRVERSAQAVQVAAWGDFSMSAAIAQTFPGDGGTPSISVGPTLPAEFVVTVRNASQLPIHNLWLQVYVPELDRPGHWVPVADYSVGRVLPEETKTIDLLDSLKVWPAHDMPSPSNPIYRRLVEEFAARGVAHDSPPSSAVAVGWYFRDNSHMEWVREPGVSIREGVRPVVTVPEL